MLHLDEFAEVLEAKGNTTKHVDETVSYCRKTINACSFEAAIDLDPVKLSSHVADLRREGWSASNINHRLTALKGFTRWLYRSGRIAQDPMVQISKLNTRTDRRHVRRAVSVDEAVWLLGMAQQGPVVCELPGTDRAMLYRLAIDTGIRASELGSLAPRSFLWMLPR